MRLLVIIAVALAITGCGPAPEAARRDETQEPWYPQTVAQLAAMNRDAEAFFQSGKREEAGALIEKAQPVVARVLSVRQPTLPAAEAASDLDDLYGRMLLTNRHYAWARFMFQKNVARWKHWSPQTAETARRLKQANDAIAECDRGLAGP